ncbi:MAG: TIGR02757 family protein [Acidobacteria bacterium]|nr:TIGR02757 family protein [Acidobacteriota bacterium]
MQRPSAGAAALTTLAPALDRAYHSFNLTHSTRDPIWTVRRFSDPADREVVAFIASALAFGRVQSVLQTVDAVLGVMGPSPAAFLRAFTPERAVAFDGLGHRWIRSRDLAALAWQLHQMLGDGGSLEGFFAEGGRHAGDETVEAAIESFSRRAMALDLAAIYGRHRPAPGVGYFFSRPSSGGACKRLNLFLRWVVRQDAVDLGLWRTVRPAQLIVPLDTHIIRVGRCLGLTSRVSPGWKMAVDITASLRRLAPDDPVRYDFSMCHIGMMGACGFGTTRTNAQCPLHAVCRPRRAGKRA